jgi:cysteinyl-tRNA synthetase
MFVCGQTVYDDAHLGHAKNYVNFDVVARFLRHSGYTVHYVQNITDVDDKIINRAREQGKDALELAEHFTKRFFEDMEKLNVRQSVDQYPKSTDYMKQIIEQIETLMKKGYAYAVDGDVYFDVKKFKDYTKLSRMRLEDLERHRIEPDDRKRNSYDFSLWKSAKGDEIAWDSPWGRGRPGWHIEDTAMTVAIFGPQYDIHGGANELIFPHHTNEIAQAEAATGNKPFVKYWMHSGVLKIGGEKMSKSLKNFITVRESLKRHSPETVRMWISSAHYRKPIDYDEKDIEQAKTKVEKLRETLARIDEAAAKGKSDGKMHKKIVLLHEKFHHAMEDDFNTPLALSQLFEALSVINAHIDSGEFSKKEIQDSRELVVEMADIFQIIPPKRKEKIPKEAEKLIEEREEARKRGDYEKSDFIRKRLEDEFGIVLEDTKSGVKWKLSRD